MMIHYYDVLGQRVDSESGSAGRTWVQPPADDLLLPPDKVWCFTGSAWVVCPRQAPAPNAPPEPAVDTRPHLVVTSVSADQPIQLAPDLSECTMRLGTIATIRAELRAPDGTVVPLTDAFRMPMRKRGGGEGMLLAEMVDGVVSITAQMTNQGDDGVWIVDEETINARMPPSMRMRFSGFVVNIYR